MFANFHLKYNSSVKSITSQSFLFPRSTQ
jgi:hypothetical protein